MKKKNNNIFYNIDIFFYSDIFLILPMKTLIDLIACSGKSKWNHIRLFIFCGFTSS